MKFSQQWIQEFLSNRQDVQAMISILTMAGLEVDGVEPCAPAFEGVIVGEVISVQPHPKSSKLSLTQVNIGQAEPLDIVCGASVQENQKVAVAKIGARLTAILPEDQKIEARTLQGHTSHGMLLSEQELGLAPTSDNLMSIPEDAKVGSSVWELLDLDDQVIDIDLTPNRGDCTSIMGIARELGVLTQDTFHPLQVDSIPSTIEEKISIDLQAPLHCPRYVGRIIKNIKFCETPLWMKERLRRCDIRSIHPVVDILNYVMIEMGQPMHAFDLDKLNDSIVVRLAKSGETIELLDGQKLELKPDTLVIADNQKAHALAGIMGGLQSSVTEQTNSILLESALFNAVTQAGKARQYGLHTDSSYRFERGVDPNLQTVAIERATKLILEICGGEASDVLEQVDTNHLPDQEEIQLRLPRIERILGISFNSADVQGILQRIGCKVISTNDDESSITILPPSYRYDLKYEIDLIEEVARVHGYENIPSELPVTSLRLFDVPESNVSTLRIKQAMVDIGYHEVITYSFVDSKWQDILFPNEAKLPLLNPISQDMDTMRLSLLPGLLKAVDHNQRRQQNRLMLFEVGNRFWFKDNHLQQTEQLGGICYGDRYPETWRQGNQPFDFYDLKAHIDRIWQLTQKPPLQYKDLELEINQNGQSAGIFYQDQQIGLMGKLNIEKAKQLDVQGPVYWFTCELPAFKQKEIPKFVRPSKFPEIRRDIAIIIDKDIQSTSLSDYVGNIANEWLQKITIFDEYSGKGIQEGRKSIGMGLILQHPSRTLIDQEVNDLMDKLVKGLKQEFGAELRD